MRHLDASNQKRPLHRNGSPKPTIAGKFITIAQRQKMFDQFLI
jgi:hypothetical protein